MKAVIVFIVTAIVAISADAARTRRSASAIASVAEGYVTSTAWSYSGCLHGSCNAWKCNMFVADVISEAGYDYPSRRWWIYSPIGANEWANPSSSYLTSDRCWQLTNSPSRGDVAAHGGHVGIVTRYGETVSATRDTVVQNDWGFRSGQNPTFWENVC